MKLNIQWTSVGSIMLTAAVNTIVTVVNRRNQEKMIEKIGEQIGKKVAEDINS